MPAVPPCIICGACGVAIEIPPGYPPKPIMAAHDKVCSGTSVPAVRAKVKTRKRKAVDVLKPLDDAARAVGEELGRAGVEWLINRLKRR